MNRVEVANLAKIALALKHQATLMYTMAVGMTDGRWDRVWERIKDPKPGDIVVEITTGYRVGTSGIGWLIKRSTSRSTSETRASCGTSRPRVGPIPRNRFGTSTASMARGSTAGSTASSSGSTTEGSEGMSFAKITVPQNVMDAVDGASQDWVRESERVELALRAQIAQKQAEIQALQKMIEPWIADIDEMNGHKVNLMLRSGALTPAQQLMQIDHANWYAVTMSGTVPCLQGVKDVINPFVSSGWTESGQCVVRTWDWEKFRDLSKERAVEAMTEVMGYIIPLKSGTFAGLRPLCVGYTEAMVFMDEKGGWLLKDHLDREPRKAKNDRDLFTWILRELLIENARD